MGAYFLGPPGKKKNETLPLDTFLTAPLYLTLDMSIYLYIYEGE